MQLKPIALLGVLVIVVAGAIGYHQYSSDMAGWNQVQQSLTRLSSGVEFEAIITLRSKVADTDAVIKTFESEFHLFPLHYPKRLESGRRGVQYLGIAIDDAKSIKSWDDLQDFLEVTKFVPRKCEGDHLVFSTALIKGAFVLAGSYLVKDAVGQTSDKDKKMWQDGFYPMLDLPKENAACQHANAVALRLSEGEKKAAEAAHLGQWRLHVDVRAIGGGAMDVRTSSDEGPESEIHLYESFGGKHIDGNNQVRLEIEWPDDPSNLRVTVNGKLWTSSNWTEISGSYPNSPLGKKYVMLINFQR